MTKAIPGADILAMRAQAADAENFAIIAKQNIDRITQAYLSLEIEVVQLRKDAEKWREWHEAQDLIEQQMPEGYRVVLDMSPGDWSLRAEDDKGEPMRIEDYASTAEFIRDAVEIARSRAAAEIGKSMEGKNA